MIVGFILTALWDALIWLSFAGVAMFAAAFLWSFVRPLRTRGSAKEAKGSYWRGRYIEYDPGRAGVLKRIKRAFSRRP